MPSACALDLVSTSSCAPKESTARTILPTILHLAPHVKVVLSALPECQATVERQFSGKKTLKELLVEHIVSVKKKEDAKNAPDIDEIA